MLTLIVLFLVFRMMIPWRRYRPWGMFMGGPHMWRRPPMGGMFMGGFGPHGPRGFGPGGPRGFGGGRF